MTHPETPDDASAPRRASLGQVISAVLWSFFGVRRRDAMNRDAGTIRPWQVIAVHVAIAATLVITVVTVASLVAYPQAARDGELGSPERV